MTDTRRAADPTIDENVVAHFAALAAQWWDPRGKMGVLHKFNPVRLAFIKETICRYSGRDGRKLDALMGLRILDIGCGAGILSALAGAFWAPIRRRKISPLPSSMPPGQVWKSTTARRPCRLWHRKGRALTSCLPWRSWSTSPT